MSVMETIYGEIRELHVCDDSTVVEDLKGRIEGGTRRTVVFLDEQRRQPRPLGPVITLRSIPKDMFVEWEIKCDSAQSLSVISKVFTVSWPTRNSYTIAPG